MNDRRQTGMQMADSLLGAGAGQMMDAAEGFGGEIGQLALDNVFASLWTREGLSRRDRSLVTLGILIALRAENELHFHFPIAIQNGLTKEELAEVIYHATGYAGFPAAASARTVATKIFDKA